MLRFHTSPIWCFSITLWKRKTRRQRTAVLCACNTVQLLQCCISPEPCPQKSPKLKALITRFRESYSSVNMSREPKRLKKSSSNLLNSRNALIQWKCNFCVPVLPGSAEAQVIWGGILKRLLIVYLISSIFYQKIPKSVHICQSYSKPKVGRFWDTVYMYR